MDAPTDGSIVLCGDAAAARGTLWSVAPEPGRLSYGPYE
jgi:hypothetical protein